MPIVSLASGYPSRLGAGSNYVNVAADGTLTLVGAATAFDDLLRDATSTRTGVVAPTTAVGFRGDNNFYETKFVSNQADEVQFEIQLPHRGRAGSVLFPHVHFMPTASSTGDKAVQFILEYYAANVDAQFPASPANFTMTKTWNGNKQFYHLLAGNESGLSLEGWTLSNVLKCRLYRDNAVANNYADPVTFLYFDIHVEIDAFGSASEYAK